MPKYILEYDVQSDSTYIKLRGTKIEESIEAENGVILDIDKKGHLVGIEILNFSKSTINIQELVTGRFNSIVSVIR